MNFALIQLSSATDLTSSVLLQMSAAIQRQLIEHYASFWQSEGAGVVVVSDISLVGENDCPVVILDNADQAGELGFHATIPDGRPYSRIFVQPIYAAGGTALSGQFAVSATVSHEVLEALADPYCNFWADMPDGVTEDALELCDRVENDSYEIDGVSVSNFLGPRAFSQGPGPYDWLQQLGSPFDLRPGGYAIRRTGGPAGNVTNVWGNEMPAWRKDSKDHPASRTFRRMHRP